MISLKIREGIGWVFVGLGLILIWFVFDLAMKRQILEAFALSLPATIVFRAGIGFVKLAMAGRIAERLSQRDTSHRPPHA